MLKIFLFGRIKRLEFGKARQFSTFPDDAGVVISPRSHPTLDRQREEARGRGELRKFFHIPAGTSYVLLLPSFPRQKYGTHFRILPSLSWPSVQKFPSFREIHFSLLATISPSLSRARPRYGRFIFTKSSTMFLTSIV